MRFALNVMGADASTIQGFPPNSSIVGGVFSCSFRYDFSNVGAAGKDDVIPA